MTKTALVLLIPSVNFLAFLSTLFQRLKPAIYYKVHSKVWCQKNKNAQPTTVLSFSWVVVDRCSSLHVDWSSGPSVMEPPPHGEARL